MNIIDSIAEYLEDESIATMGTDLYKGELPFDVDDCLSLQFVPSPEPNKAIPYYTQTVDVWARYKLFDTGMEKLQEIMELLHRKENYDINGYHVYLSYALGMIDDLGRDVERRHLFKLTLSFVYRQGAELS